MRTTQSNIFLHHAHPAPGCGAADVEQAMIAQTKDFALPAFPDLAPALLSHRILRSEQGVLAWEITYDGMQAEDVSESLGDAVHEEVCARLAGVAEVDAPAAFVDLLRPPPDRGFSQTDEDLRAFGDELPGWESHASGSGEPEAGAVLPKDLIDTIVQHRASAPKEPNLKPHGKGFMYTGAADKAHTAYLKSYLDARAARASSLDRRKILAFLAFQAREGSTAAINTYDNQIVTWGTGWSGRAWLGIVLGRAVTNEAFRDALGRAGVRFLGKNTYDVVDVAARVVVTGKEPALEIIRSSTDLLHVLIDLARNPATRDAATEAQLVTFMGGSANVSSGDAVATQALFNYIVHLRHWLSGYAAGCLEWALPQVTGDPTPERDRRLSVLVTRYFYGKARTAKGAKVIPSWVQLLRYIEHMKADGLDCTGDPFFQAKEAPEGNPFEAAPLPSAAVVRPLPTKPTQTTSPSVPAAPVAAPVDPPPADQGSQLTNPPLSGQSMLDLVAQGKAVLRRGVRGDAVKALQEALIALKIDVPGGADGDFGGGLERAIKAFQSARGLHADGTVGRMTLAAVDAALGASRSIAAASHPAT